MKKLHECDIQSYIRLVSQPLTSDVGPAAVAILFIRCLPASEAKLGDGLDDTDAKLGSTIKESRIRTKRLFLNTLRGARYI